jgi:hypothetical protein
MPAILDLNRSSFRDESTDDLPFELVLGHVLINAAAFLRYPKGSNNPVEKASKFPERARFEGEFFCRFTTFHEPDIHKAVFSILLLIPSLIWMSFPERQVAPLFIT